VAVEREQAQAVVEDHCAAVDAEIAGEHDLPALAASIGMFLTDRS
jgi:hypothetical protein